MTDRNDKDTRELRELFGVPTGKTPPKYEDAELRALFTDTPPPPPPPALGSPEATMEQETASLEGVVNQLPAAGEFVQPALSATVAGLGAKARAADLPLMARTPLAFGGSALRGATSLLRVPDLLMKSSEFALHQQNGHRARQLAAMAEFLRKTNHTLRGLDIFAETLARDVPAAMEYASKLDENPMSISWWMLNIASGVGSSAAPLAGAVATGVATGNPVLAAAVGGIIAGAAEAGLEYDDYYHKLREQGVPHAEAEETAAAGSIAYGVVSGAIEVMGINKLPIWLGVPKPVKQRIKSKIARTAILAVTEMGEEGAQMFVDFMIETRLLDLPPDADIEEVLQSLLIAFATGVILGGPSVAIQDRFAPEQAPAGAIEHLPPGTLTPDEQRRNEARKRAEAVVTGKKPAPVAGDIRITAEDEGRVGAETEEAAAPLPYGGTGSPALERPVSLEGEPQAPSPPAGRSGVQLEGEGPPLIRITPEGELVEQAEEATAEPAAAKQIKEVLLIDPKTGESRTVYVTEEELGDAVEDAEAEEVHGDVRQQPGAETLEEEVSAKEGREGVRKGGSKKKVAGGPGGLITPESLEHEELERAVPKSAKEQKGKRVDREHGRPQEREGQKGRQRQPTEGAEVSVNVEEVEQARRKILHDLKVWEKDNRIRKGTADVARELVESAGLVPVVQLIREMPDLTVGQLAKHTADRKGTVYEVELQSIMREYPGYAEDDPIIPRGSYDAVGAGIVSLYARADEAQAGPDTFVHEWMHHGYDTVLTPQQRETYAKYAKKRGVADAQSLFVDEGTDYILAKMAGEQPKRWPQHVREVFEAAYAKLKEILDAIAVTERSLGLESQVAALYEQAAQLRKAPPAVKARAKTEAAAEIKLVEEPKAKKKAAKKTPAKKAKVQKPKVSPARATSGLGSFTTFAKETDQGIRQPSDVAEQHGGLVQRIWEWANDRLPHGHVNQIPLADSIVEYVRGGIDKGRSSLSKAMPVIARHSEKSTQTNWENRFIRRLEPELQSAIEREFADVIPSSVARKARAAARTAKLRQGKRGLEIEEPATTPAAKKRLINKAKKRPPAEQELRERREVLQSEIAALEQKKPKRAADKRQITKLKNQVHQIAIALGEEWDELTKKFERSNIADGVTTWSGKLGKKDVKFTTEKTEIYAFDDDGPASVTPLEVANVTVLTEGLTDKELQSLTRIVRNADALRTVDGNPGPVVVHYDNESVAHAAKRLGYELPQQGTMFQLVLPVSERFIRMEQKLTERSARKFYEREISPYDFNRFNANRLTNKTIKSIVAWWKVLPEDLDFETAAKMGMIGKGWYERAAKTLHYMTMDPVRFTAAFAALSPRRPVTQDFIDTMRVWTAWVQAGQPTGKRQIESIVKKHAPFLAGTSQVAVYKAFTWDHSKLLAEKYGGFKVDSFFLNLMNEVMAVTLDAHMGGFIALDSGDLLGNVTLYRAYAARIRKIADQMGMTPTEVQETIWTFVSVMKSLRKQGDTDADLVGKTPFEALEAAPFLPQMIDKDRYPNVAEAYEQAVAAGAVRAGAPGTHYDRTRKQIRDAKALYRQTLSSDRDVVERIAGNITVGTSAVDPYVVAASKAHGTTVWQLAKPGEFRRYAYITSDQIDSVAEEGLDVDVVYMDVSANPKAGQITLVADADPAARQPDHYIVPERAKDPTLAAVNRAIADEWTPPDNTDTVRLKLDEFDYAIIPPDTPREVTQKLYDAGLELPWETQYQLMPAPVKPHDVGRFLDDEWAVKRELYRAQADARLHQNSKKLHEVMLELGYEKKWFHMWHHLKNLWKDPKGRPTERMFRKAIMLYVDLWRRDVAETEAEIDKWWDQLTPEQQKIVTLSRNLPYKVWRIAERVRRHNRRQGRFLANLGVLKSFRENYIARIWDFEGHTQPHPQRIALQNNRMKARKLDSILEGWAKGYELKIDDAFQAQQLASHQMGDVIADRQLLVAMLKLGLAKTKPTPGYKELEVGHFYRWKWVGNLEALLDEETGLAAVPELEGVPIREWLKADLFIRDVWIDLGTESTEAGIYRKVPVFIKSEYADALNRSLGTSRFREMPVVRAFDVVNAQLKATVLMTTLFHHQAFLRSTMFGGPGKEWLGFQSPRQAWLAGKQAVMGFTPEAQLLIRAGMTTGLAVDYQTNILEQKTAAGKIIDKIPIARNLRNEFIGIRDFQIDFLFQTMGVYLKMGTALLELRHLLKQNAAKVQANPDLALELAKAVASAQNTDFGGLNIGRAALYNKNITPEALHIYRAVALAPDWTSSNVLSAWRALPVVGNKSQQVRALHQVLWSRIFVRWMYMGFMLNMLMAWMDPDEDLEDIYRRAWEAGNLRWMGVDITPMLKLLGYGSPRRQYFNLLGHFRDPVRWVRHPFKIIKHKTSVPASSVIEAVVGNDWAGRRFTTFPELLGKDDKGVYKTTSVSGGWRKGQPKGGKLAGKLVTWNYERRGPIELEEFPSYLLSQLAGYTPVQLQSFMSYLAGHQDGVQAIARATGFDVVPEPGTEEEVALKTDQARQASRRRVVNNLAGVAPR